MAREGGEHMRLPWNPGYNTTANIHMTHVQSKLLQAGDMTHVQSKLLQAGEIHYSYM